MSIFKNRILSPIGVVVSQQIKCGRRTDNKIDSPVCRAVKDANKPTQNPEANLNSWNMYRKSNVVKFSPNRCP